MRRKDWMKPKELAEYKLLCEMVQRYWPAGEFLNPAYKNAVARGCVILGEDKFYQDVAAGEFTCAL